MTWLSDRVSPEQHDAYLAGYLAANERLRRLCPGLCPELGKVNAELDFEEWSKYPEVGYTPHGR